jgi:hypothetical protein
VPRQRVDSGSTEETSTGIKDISAFQIIECPARPTLLAIRQFHWQTFTASCTELDSGKDAAGKNSETSEGRARSNSESNEGTTGSYPQGRCSVARPREGRLVRAEREEAMAVGDEMGLVEGTSLSSREVMYL